MNDNTLLYASVTTAVISAITIIGLYIYKIYQVVSTYKSTGENFSEEDIFWISEIPAAIFFLALSICCGIKADSTMEKQHVIVLCFSVLGLLLGMGKMVIDASGISDRFSTVGEAFAGLGVGIALILGVFLTSFAVIGSVAKLSEWNNSQQPIPVNNGQQTGDIVLVAVPTQ